MMKPTIHKDFDTYYLVQDIGGLSLFERTQAINKFVKHDTVILEKYIDNLIKADLMENGINAYSNKESVLNGVLEQLKTRGISYLIEDTYKRHYNDNDLKFVAISDNQMIVLLENDRYLQCGIRLVKERL